LYYLENRYDYHRFAISVNRKIGNSVERNFIKRKMKEVFRVNQHLINKKHDIWVVIKKGFDRENNWQAAELLIKSMQNVSATVDNNELK